MVKGQGSVGEQPVCALSRQDCTTEGHGAQQQAGQGNSGTANTGPNA